MNRRSFFGAVGGILATLCVPASLFGSRRHEVRGQTFRGHRACQRALDAHDHVEGCVFEWGENRGLTIKGKTDYVMKDCVFLHDMHGGVAIGECEPILHFQDIKVAAISGIAFRTYARVPVGIQFDGTANFMEHCRVVGDIGPG